MTRPGGPLAWLLLLGLLAPLWAWAANGAALFYYDTVGYLAQGESILTAAGWAPAPGPEVAPAPGPEPAAEGAGGAPEPEADETVVGSRSAPYGIAMAAVVRLAGAPWPVVLLNLAAIGAATALAARRIAPAGFGSARVAALGVLAASLGSLPFYVAYLMPDILAPVLVLTVATLAAWGPAMRWGERLLAVGLALLAVLSHPSHLLMAALLLPTALLAAMALSGRRAGLALGLVGLLVLGGVAERLAFAAAVERFERQEVVYLPFLTARLIDDGPGLAFLEARCPDPGRPTCALLPPLEASDDPGRLDAPNILFARDPALASFRALPQAEQDAVSRDHLRFVRDVLRDRPGAVAAALARNVAVQLGMVRVDMTLPEPGTLEGLGGPSGPGAALREGRLASLGEEARDRLALGHALLYLLSLVALGLALLRARRADLTAFALLVLAGIAINAVVCGGISEPADRYGARVAFLLPLVAAMAWAASPRGPARGHPD